MQLVKIPKIKFDFDWFLILIPLILVLCGISTLYSISSFGTKTTLATDQVVFLLVAAVVYTLLALFDYRQFNGAKWYLFFIGIFFLLLVEIFGQSIFGSRRWIDIGFFRFQPSEMMKLILVIFGSSFFSLSKNTTVKQLVYFVLLCLIPILLVIGQPDLGTTLVLAVIAVANIFSSGASRRILLVSALIIALLVPVGWFSLKPYQKERLVSFVDPEHDPLGSGYNVSQSKITVGSGGFYGKGFGGATQSQLQFLPVSHIDFIFAGWAESTGFIGSAFLVLMFAVIIWRLFAIASMARDKLGFMICISVGSLLLFQTFVNIGMNIGIMPVTGIPLPLVSYGGTSLIITSAMLGICQSIYLRRKSLRFD